MTHTLYRFLIFKIIKMDHALTFVILRKVFSYIHIVLQGSSIRIHWVFEKFLG